MGWIWIDEEDDCEPDWQPIPGKPGWLFDAARGEYEPGVSAERTGIAPEHWFTLWRGVDMTAPKG